MDDTFELLRAAREGNEKARKKVIENNIRLVWSVARRFQNRGQDLEDLFQIGCIGLVKAIDHFDLSRPVQLSTYAVPMIMGEIKRFLRDDGMVKVSRTMKENGYKVKLAADRISGTYGREATMEEIAAATELSIEEITMALEANVYVDSIDRVIGDAQGEGVCIHEHIADKKDEQQHLENRIFLEGMLEQLTDMEKKIITLRYYQDKTQTQIGEILHISQVQVSRMEKRALKKMREMCNR